MKYYKLIISVKLPELSLFHANNTFLAFLMSLFISFLSAQESINTSGGQANGSGGIVSYSVGQVFYITDIDATGSVAKGVQQPFEITVDMETIGYSNINLNVSVYPNPTSDLLILSINENDYTDFTNFNCCIFDINGKLLKTEKILSNETVLNISEYAPSTYFVKVLLNDEVVKVFKTIKK